MEFDFTVTGLTSHQVTIWDAAALKRLSQEDAENFKKVLDSFGKRSAKAQGLSAPITDVYRLRATDQRLYLAATRHNGNTIILGGLKTGSKKLFVRTVEGSLQEVEPQCVLDFYVHEDYQRKGVGKQLFEFFLATEQLHPGGIAYDRPSAKLLAFLSRHYGLHDYQPQNNNFVLFDMFWKLNAGAASTQQKSRRGVPQLQPSRPAAAIPAWVAGLPSSSRPLVGATAAALPPLSLTSSPANTMQAHGALDSWQAHSPSTQPTMGQQGSNQQGDWGMPSGQGQQYQAAGGPAAPQSPQSPQQQYGRPPSFGRRGSAHAPPGLGPYPSGGEVTEYQPQLAGSQQHPVPHLRGDALDTFRSGQPQPQGHVGQQWPGAGQQGGSASARVWQMPGASVHTPQGPAYLYTAMPAPAASGGGGGPYGAGYSPTQASGGMGAGYSPMHGAAGNAGYYPGSGAQAVQQEAGGYGMQGSAGPMQQALYGRAGSAQSSAGGGPRYTVPPWGQDGDGPAVNTRPGRGNSQQQWTPPPHQHQQHMGQQHMQHGPGGQAPMSSPAHLVSTSFGKGGSKPGGAVSARDAALAARAGSGAAGCLVW